MRATLKNDYVRYENGHRKWYRAVFEITFQRIRVSRRVFHLASDAAEYSRTVRWRLRHGQN